MPGDKPLRLESLYEKIRNDPSYRTIGMGTTFVPGDGDPDSGIVLIGEAPGQDEERLRKPFVGAAGRNLSELLSFAGLSRDGVFITNLVKYRPFDGDGRNRKPTPAESRKAFPYLTEELSVLEPAITICLGSSSAAMLLEEKSLRMGEANGKFFDRGGRKILVSYHPSPYNYLDERKRAAMKETFGVLAAFLKNVRGS